MIHGGIIMESMNKEKIKRFVLEHKTEICIFGGTIIAIGLGYFGYKYIPKIKVGKVTSNSKTSRQITETVAKKVPCKELCGNLVDEMLVPIVTDDTSAPVIKIIDVREHLRNLPTGYHPSKLKLTEALNMGVELLDNQTIVSSHTRCYAA